MTGNADDGRNRLTFEVDDDLQPAISEMARGEKTKAVNTALRRHLYPEPRQPAPYWIVTPASKEEVELKSILSRAKQNVTLVGTTLRFTSRQYAADLEQLLDADVRLTFITIAPDLCPNDPLYELLARQMGSRELVVAMRHESADSIKDFAKLRSYGLAKGVGVSILTCNILPTYGLAIVDQGTRCPWMRVNFYHSLQLHRVHPSLEVDVNTPQGADVYEGFLSYYVDLLRRCTERADVPLVSDNTVQSAL
jgi:hypothetical protein